MWVKLRVWDAASAKQLWHFGVHKGKVVSCTFSPDGKRVLGGLVDADALRLTQYFSASSAASTKTFWHFPNGWASTSSADDPAPKFGGSGWYWLRAVGEDANGRRREWMMEEVVEVSPG